jgi:hypothetical protein
MFLQKAVKCFELAGDQLLRDRAQVQMQLDVLYSNVMRSEGGAWNDREAASIVLRALQVGLDLEEIEKVCEVIADLVVEDVYYKQTLVRGLRLRGVII